MKNIHILPTDKPSRLHEYDYLSPMGLSKKPLQWRLGRHVYITSDEEIKEGYYLDLTHNIVMQSVFYQSSDKNCKKIILTTDETLIKNGVQAIDDEFLEWFVKNPNCEEVETYHVGYVNVYNITIPKEEPKQKSFNSKRELKEIQLKDPNTCEYYKEVGCIKDICDCYTLIEKQETIEEAMERQLTCASERMGFKLGVKWQAERMYSEEDMKQAFESNYDSQNYGNSNLEYDFKEWFEQFKKK